MKHKQKPKTSPRVIPIITLLLGIFDIGCNVGVVDISTVGYWLELIGEKVGYNMVGLYVGDSVGFEGLKVGRKVGNEVGFGVGQR